MTGAKFETLKELLVQAVRENSLIQVVLSSKRPDSEIDKAIVRPIVLKTGSAYQLAVRKGPKELHETITAEQLASRIVEVLELSFNEARVFTEEADHIARRNRDGSIQIKQLPPTKTSAEAVGHNRAKNYLIPEGVPCPFLAEIGVMTAEGRVHAAKTAKFRQINRFLELVDDVTKALPAEGPLRIVDFGCGKSYLTFALYHLFRVVHGRDAQIIGLDREKSVVETCSRVARKLGFADLEFRTGTIAEYDLEGRVDMVVSLHACDTATDDAIAKAVHWQAPVILAVPCCQHELARTIEDSRELLAIERHGILKERFAAIATDALRAQALEICGYRTQVVEFIDMEHTAKNLLIRAVRRTTPHPDEQRLVDEYRQLKQSLGVPTFHLEQALGEEFSRRVGQAQR